MSETMTQGESPAQENAPVETADQAPAAQPENPETGTGETQTEQQQTPPERPVEKRIGELTRLRREAEREADYLRGRLAEIERSRAAPSGDKPALPQVPQGVIEQAIGAKPDPSKFAAGEFDPGFIAQTAAWEARAEVARMGFQQRQMQEAQRQQEAQRAQTAKVSKLVEEGGRRFPDFEERVLSDATLPITPAMVDAIAESESGADVAYWLANNRDEAARIARLSPAAAAREIGRLEARIEREREAASVSKAPAPVQTVAGSNNRPAAKFDVLKASDDDLAAWLAKTRR